MPVTGEDFEFIQALARETAALVIEPGNEYLVESRLAPVARQAGFETLDAFLRHLRLDPKATHEPVVAALTTKETSFFRDFHPFETLRQHILPPIIEQRTAARQLALWSAGCSTGQEAYTIALLLREYFPQLKDWTIAILGTDLSPTVLQQAREGLYSQLEVNRGMPAALLSKYFSKVDAKWAVNDEIKQLVEFRQMNLAKPWPTLPLFDVVFVRNVMNALDTDAKKRILRQIRQCLLPHGSLFLGAVETTANLDPEWHSVPLGRATVYHPRPAVPAAA
jgi:chemotaxis protein methyltransferase CheR